MNVIKTGLLFFIFFFFCSQAKDGISVIKTKCELINKNLKNFSRKTIEDAGQSADGGTITAYYERSKLQRITAEYFGESGKNNSDYYFDDGVLIFVVEKDFKYNRPYYYDKKAAQENDDTEWYDNKKTKIETNRFYFNNGILFKWVNAANKENPVDSAKSKKCKSELNRLVKLLR